MGTACDKGAEFAHLRAARQLILIMKSSTHGPLHNNLAFGLILETYAYLALVQNITPYGLLCSRELPLDDFITSLRHLEQYETYGTQLSCGYDIFECILPIAMLARRRLDESASYADASLQIRKAYQTLHAQLESLIQHSMLSKTLSDCRSVYVSALHIFLEAGLHNPLMPDEHSLFVIQSHIDSILHLTPSICETPYGTIMLWPLMIASSCMTRKEQQDLVQYRFLNTSQWRISQVLTAVRILRLLWEQRYVGKSTFGPYGLYEVMKEYNMNFSMA